MSAPTRQLQGFTNCASCEAIRVNHVQLNIDAAMYMQ